MKKIDFNDFDKFKKDVEVFYTFLLEKAEIDILANPVSLEFLKSMILFAGIGGSINYTNAVCYYLLYKAKYPKSMIVIRERD
jgi:hypothetical protein